MGNTPKEVNRSYKQLVKHKEEAVMYFKIKPPVYVEPSDALKKEVTIEDAVEAFLNIERIKPMMGAHGEKWVDKDLVQYCKNFERVIHKFTWVKELDEEGNEYEYFSNDKQDELFKALSWRTSPVARGKGSIQIKVYNTDEDFEVDKQYEKGVMRELVSMGYSESVKRRKKIDKKKRKKSEE
jgi:hypothetical protein